MTEKNLSKTDTIGCALHKLADAIELIDDKFADEKGNIKIEGIEGVLELAGLLYSTVESVYVDCLGREFKIKTEGPAGKILELVLEILLKDRINP